MKDNQDINTILELTENELKTIFEQMSIEELVGLMEKVNEVSGNE